jgi:hypothetical protein
MNNQTYNEQEAQHKALIMDADYFVKENSEDFFTRTTGQLPTNESMAL